MSTTIGTVNKKVASVVCLSGQIVKIEDYKLGEAKEYTEYHKREVFLLKYFFQLFVSVLRVGSPDQFQIFECYPVPKGNLILYPYRIEFKTHNTDLFMWIILVPDNNGKLFAFARTRPCVVGLTKKDLSNPELVWEKD